MDTVLVVLDSSNADETLLETVRQHVAGIDLGVVLCRIVDRDEYEGDVQNKAKAGERVNSVEEVESEARAEAERVAEEHFDGAVTYTSVGIVGTIPDDVLTIADEHGSGHAFIAGRKRSPAGKVLFGDNAQKLLLDFDGPVTVVTDPA